MQMAIGILVLILSYLLGSVPFGLLIVKFKTGQDIREIQSGRTGGTNAMRAAGLWAGIATAILDLLKGVVGVLLAKWLSPDLVWISVLAPVFIILGHNYSVFLVERNPQGKIEFHGGAGGAPSAGGSMGLWPPIILIILPVAGIILYFVGYASVATLSAPIITTIVFVVMAWAGKLPWEYSVYGILAAILLAWSLRPNIQRLRQGNERLIGLRAKRAKAAQEKSENPDN